MNKQKKSKKFRWLRIIGRIILGIFIFIFLLLLFIRSPWGQNIIVQKLTSFVEGKTHTKVAVQKVFISFTGNVVVEDLYLEDTQKDTLLYSHELEANIALLPLIKGEGFYLKALDWKKVTANVQQQDSTQGFNYQFLIDAFASDTTQTTEATDTTKTFQIGIGKINLESIHLNYTDAVSGMQAKGNIGELQLSMQTFDLEHMKFEVAQATIANTSLAYTQSKALPESTEPSEGPLPYLGIHNLSLKEVKTTYKSVPDGILLKAHIAESSFAVPEIDLTQQHIEAATIRLHNSEINLAMQSKGEAPKTKTATTPFQWPDWEVTLEELDLANNSIQYTVDGAQPTTGALNPNAISLKAITLQGTNLSLAHEKVEATFSNIQGTEASGIQLQQLGFKAAMTSTAIHINDLALQLNNNSLHGSLQASYTSIQELIDNPEAVKLAVDMPKLQVRLQDLLQLQPQLKENSYVATLATKGISGSLHAKGTLEHLYVHQTRLKWGQHTSVAATATLQNISNPDLLQFNVEEFKATTTQTDLNRFIATDSLGIQVPETATLVVSGNGNLNDITATAQLQTPDGNLAVDGHFKNEPDIAFDADIQLQQIQLGKVLQNKALDTVSLALQLNGSGTTLNTLNATLSSDIQQLSYKGYDLTPLELSGEITNGSGSINAAFKDYNLNAALTAKVVLDTLNPEVHSELTITGADLQALGLTKKNLRTQLQLNADYKGTPNNFTATLDVNDIVLVFVNEPYYPGDLHLQAQVQQDSTSVQIDNDMLQLQLQANADIEHMSNALQRYYTNLMSADTIAYDTISNPVNLHLNAHFKENALLSDVFVPGLEAMDTLAIRFDFEEAKQAVLTDVFLPRLQYNEMELDSLALHIDAQTNTPSFSFGINKIDAGPIQMQRLSFDGHTADKKMQLNFNAFDNETRFVHLGATAQRVGDSVKYHINQDSLLLNNKRWTVPENNLVTLTKNNIQFQDFSFTNNQQQVSFGNDMTDKIDKEHVGVDFKGFKLEDVLAILNPDDPIAKGTLDGKLILVEPYGRTALLAGLDITNLEALHEPLGNLSLKARALGTERYDVNLALKDGGIDLDVKGDYTAHRNGADLNFNIDLNKFQLSTLNNFTNGQVKDTEGYIDGQLAIKGTTAAPDFSGALAFHQAQLNIQMLNTPFKIDNETIALSNEGIQFNQFTIKDVDNNTFVLDGDINTTEPLTPAFDLHLKADHFQLLNATEDDNDLFYGTANINADIQIQGDMDMPIVDATLNANEGTDIYYVLSEAELNKEERDGIVVFVNRKNPDAILTRNEEEQANVLTGMRLNTLLSLNKNAAFNVIINEQTGDNLKIAGEGDLNFHMDENGRSTLTGRYEVTDGHYQMNLYGLVKRKFDFAPGSSVTWSGDPLDAQLDISAIYNIKTSAASLMADQSSGTSDAVKSVYRQRVPFQVYLNVDGELMRPQLSFNLDIPEEERNIAGGAIYSKVQQLNQEEDNLNKQVFSLLVLNRFFPASGSDGSNGGTASIARDNLSQALTDQLNMFSDKLMGNSGIDLNFGVDSYTDYQGATAENRTDVDITAQKKLFNDRFIIEVGGEVNVEGSNRPGETNQVMGNLNLQYLLTEDGRFRVKAFHKNSYENIIDGQIVLNGISLIFTKEFNKFKELWKANLKEEEDAVPQENPDNQTEDEDENTETPQPKNNQKATDSE